MGLDKRLCITVPAAGMQKENKIRVFPMPRVQQHWCVYFTSPNIKKFSEMKKVTPSGFILKGCVFSNVLNYSPVFTLSGLRLL